MDSEIYAKLEANPIIAAIKNDEGLEKVIQSDISVVFILYGDILNISDIVKKLKEAHKTVFVHADLVVGFSSKEIIADYIRKYTDADGIISTKPNIVRRARELGLCGILRIFMIDSLALSGVEKQQQAAGADIVEVLPGALPKIISGIVKVSRTPIIAGGLIRDKEDVMDALKAGAIAISTTNPAVWFM